MWCRCSQVHEVPEEVDVGAPIAKQHKQVYYQRAWLRAQPIISGADVKVSSVALQSSITVLGPVSAARKAEASATLVRSVADGPCFQQRIAVLDASTVAPA